MATPRERCYAFLKALGVNPDTVYITPLEDGSMQIDVRRAGVELEVYFQDDVITEEADTVWVNILPSKESGGS